MKIFLICSVRKRTGQSDEDYELEQTKIKEYVKKLEKKGNSVYWPARDTNQNDPNGLRICGNNRRHIAEANEIHIWWNPGSEGSVFDFGMTFMLLLFEPNKKIVLANWQDIEPTPIKSFTNVVMEVSTTY